MTLPIRTLSLSLLVFLGACKAGPSAFDKSSDNGPIDTADAASLPRIPDASEVETEQLPADTLPMDVAGISDSDSVAAGDSSQATASADTTTSTPAATVAAVPAVDSSGRPVFVHPEHVRGIYLNAWAAGSKRRVEQLISLAKRTEINAFVIDIKDATGYVSHRTQVPLAKEIGADGELRIGDLPGLLRRLQAEGIYPIARIVIVKDPLLSEAHPDWAVQTKAGGVFKDGKGIVWMNPYNRKVWEYEVALAREVAEMGFPEIQWDYIRFPDIPASEKDLVAYPGAGETPKPDAIKGFLAYSREQLAPLGVKVTADVFGVTTSASRDVGIGQVWESFIGAVDVAQPMVYPSHYWQGSFGFRTPNAYPYEIVHRALTDALRRSATVEGAGTTRPWLQDFSLGKPAYDAPEVRAQIQATYDTGIQEWILWNPGSHYTEGALEPADGWTTEPTMRIANRVVPISQRQQVMDSVQAVEAAADSAKAAARAAADSAKVRKARAAVKAATDSAKAAADSARSGPAADTSGTGSRDGGVGLSQGLRRP